MANLRKTNDTLLKYSLDPQLLLRKKAAEELKKEQERKAAERRRIIEERCGKPKNIEDANEGKYICSRCSPFSNISHVFIAHLMEGREVMNGKFQNFTALPQFQF